MIDEHFLIQVICVLLSFIMGYLAGKNTKYTLWIKELMEDKHKIKLDKVD